MELGRGCRAAGAGPPRSRSAPCGAGSQPAADPQPRSPGRSHGAHSCARLLGDSALPLRSGPPPVHSGVLGLPLLYPAPPHYQSFPRGRGPRWIRARGRVPALPLRRHAPSRPALGCAAPWKLGGGGLQALPNFPYLQEVHGLGRFSAAAKPCCHPTSP